METKMKRIPQRKRDTTKKIPFLRKHIPDVELDFPALEKVGDVKLKDTKLKEKPRERIFDLINTYHRDSITWAQGLGAGEAKRRMEKTAVAADTLSDLLSCEKPEKHAIVDHYWPFKDPSFLHFRILLGLISESAEAAADEISTGPGSPGNPALGILIPKLHYIWTQAGGKGKGYAWDAYYNVYVGPFLSFVHLLLEQAGHFHTLPALHSAIRSALKV